MKISKEEFYSTASDLKIPEEKIETFWNRLDSKDVEAPFTKYLFYLGALIIISSMIWFLNAGSEIFGGRGLFVIASVYIILFILVGHFLWNKKGLEILGGLLITVAVSTVPIAIFGLMPEHAARWILMEIGTIIAGLFALWFYPFPFLTAPIFLAIWYLSFDSQTFIFGKEPNETQKSWASIGLGFIVLLISYSLDRAKKEPYAFWGYLFGTLSFWIGVTLLLWNSGDPNLILFLIVNLLLMCLSFFLKRVVLLVFGALGVVMFLSYLTYSIFEDSPYFPFVLTLVGLLIILLGVLYQKNREKIAHYFKKHD